MLFIAPYDLCKTMWRSLNWQETFLWHENRIKLIFWLWIKKNSRHWSILQSFEDIKLNKVAQTYQVGSSTHVCGVMLHTRRNSLSIFPTCVNFMLQAWLNPGVYTERHTKECNASAFVCLVLYTNKKDLERLPAAGNLSPAGNVVVMLTERLHWDKLLFQIYFFSVKYCM